jgi:hypothetical protein
MLKHTWKEKMWKQTSESERRMFTAPTPRVDNGEVMNTFGRSATAKLQRVSFAQPSLNAACTRPNQTIFSLTPFSNFLSNNHFFLLLWRIFSLNCSHLLVDIEHQLSLTLSILMEMFTLECIWHLGEGFRRLRSFWFYCYRKINSISNLINPFSLYALIK